MSRVWCLALVLFLAVALYSEKAWAVCENVLLNESKLWRFGPYDTFAEAYHVASCERAYLSSYYGLSIEHLTLYNDFVFFDDVVSGHIHVGLGCCDVAIYPYNCNESSPRTRTYNGQLLVGEVMGYDGVVDIPAEIPVSEIPCNAYLLNAIICPDGLGYVAYWVVKDNSSVFITGNGPCDVGPPYDLLPGLDFVMSPSPTPTSSPLEPTPMPPTPTPTPTPLDLTPTPTPPISIVTPTPQGTPTPSYLIAPPVVYGTPIYVENVVPTPVNDGTMLDSNIDDIEYNSDVPDVGQELIEDDSWLDTIFDLFTNHPLVDVIKGSKLTTSGELCSLRVNLYGSVIEISFCDLVDYVEIFGYFVTVCASIYAYFIIFRVS